MSSASKTDAPLDYHVRCDAVVEVVSDYLEHTLDAADTEAIEQHVVICSACARYIEQVRATMRASQALREGEPFDEASLAPLLRLFRANARQERP